MDLGLKHLAVAALGLGVLLAGRPAAAQFFSPGKLAAPHASLEGLSNCSKCHEEQKGLSAKLCLDCHEELAGRVSRGTGFHGHLTADKREACGECHADHRGLDFSMIDWPGGRDKFPHRQTGWPLAGAHAKTPCDSCHKPALIADPSVKRMLGSQPGRKTMLGLPTDCASCHFDEHRGQLDGQCGKCHNDSAWKPPVSFNHQTSAFPLRGKHQAVACAKCHPSVPDETTAANAFPKPRAMDFLRMKPLEHKSCESCHEDPHKGGFGAACASCHSETGWQNVALTGQKQTDFHDKTRFPLRGGHVAVACKSCHGPFPGQRATFKGLPFAACSDCHADAHLGQLRPASGDRPPDCGGCHTVNDFAVPRFELEQHAKTRFPLEGAHGAVACRACHRVDQRLDARIDQAVSRRLKVQKRPAPWVFVTMRPKAAPQACASCHKDEHQGQLADASGVTDCTRCHTSTSFAALTFDHAKDSRYPLTGKHAQTACAGCHQTERLRPGAAPTVRYKPIDTSCGLCHADKHHGQFAARTISAGQADAKTTPSQRRDCDHCHTTVGFSPTIFDHQSTRFTTFALEGAHAKVACNGCHRPVRIGPKLETVRYRPVPRECEACHTDFHHGAFGGFEP